MKNLKKIGYGLVALVLVLGVAVYVHLNRSLPVLDGTLKIQNLSKPVTVVRDDYGIPHIYAENRLDAFRALGFTQAGDRLFQMEMAKRMTQGTLSEIVGAIALNSDTLYRTLHLKKSAQEVLEQEKAANTPLWQEMLAYSDGVNQYARTQTLPYEFDILGFKPSEFTPLDAYTIIGHVGFSFGIALSADTAMSALSQELSLSEFQALRNDMIPMASTPSQASQFSVRDFFISMNYSFFAAFEGSNAWLISKDRSTSGASLFANDPHIGFTSPAVWYEAHLKTPDSEIYGHFLPAVPFPVLGHTPHHAWGFTMSLADDIDLYEEKIDRTEKTVIFKKQPVPYSSWEETIQVKNESPKTLTIIETPHGPLLNNILDNRDLSLKWAFHREGNHPLAALRQMALSEDMETFKQALQKATAPGLNVMYADKENIAWWIFGDMAVKQNPHSDLILNGSSGDDEYIRLLSLDEKPHSVNPASGVIVSANARPVGLSEKIRGDWQSDDRFVTISNYLAKKEKWSLDEFKALQTLNFSDRTEPLLKSLLQNLKLNDSEKQNFSTAITDLEKWDFHSEKESHAALFYHLWCKNTLLKMLAHLDTKNVDAYLATPYAWIFFERVLLDSNSVWHKNEKFPEWIHTAFLQTAKELKNKPVWGDFHTLTFVHPLGKNYVLGKILNLGPYPVSGAFNDVNNLRMRSMADNFQVNSGASTRRLIDFTNPRKSWGINPIGNSGHMKSPYFKDQIDLFINGKYRHQWMTDINDSELPQKHKLILEN